MKVTMGMKLKQLRKKQGLRQEDTALAIGVERQAVSQYESDKNRPSREKLEKLAKLYNTTTEYLCYNEDNFGAQLEYELNQKFNVKDLSEWERSYMIERIIKIYDLVK